MNPVRVLSPTRLLVATAFVTTALCLIALVPQSADAAIRCSSSLRYIPNAHPRCEQSRYANETMVKNYHDYIARKLDFAAAGCNQGWPNVTSGCNKPYPYNMFDWTDDGCSPPSPEPWKTLFNGPCQLHDFGYRNFGKGLSLNRRETKRLWIDNRFHREMRRVCFEQWSRNPPAYWECRRWATTFYLGVRAGTGLYGQLWGR